MPIPNFLHCLSLPPSHPASIHPCLRNACHLVACSIIGGRWAALEPYFAKRTRRFLDEALMLASRKHIAHFLWATVLLASYLARARRVEESYVLISSASHLLGAAGLSSTHNPEIEHDYIPDQFLLPAATTEAEALERGWLAQSVFMTDRALSVLTGYPGTFVSNMRWMPSMDEAEITYPWFKMPIVNQEELSKMWRSDEHRTTSITYLFDEVTALALSVHRNQSTKDAIDPSSIESFIRFHDTRIPPLDDAIKDSSPTVLLSHITLYGVSSMFFSLFAGMDAKARSEMLRCVHRLVEI
ncbi:hypothetical protein DL93DRAFT_1484159 [Clavulina sp. PMI_390]|nr:hypothetical protein DL93DRAFT_1484159 [Clavulina sp. PMI_390]